MKNIVRNGCLLVVIGLMCATNLRAQTDTLNFTDSLGRKQGKWIAFDTLYATKSKSIGYYKDNLRDSVWNYYYFNGALECRAYYKGGKRDGVTHYFWEDGTIKWVFVYKDDKDVWKMTFDSKGYPCYEQNSVNKKQIFYENGKWKDVAAPPDAVAGNFTDARGQKQGKWVINDPGNDKSFKAIGYFKDNLEDSIWSSYYSNGVLMCREYYKRGKEEDVAHVFRKDGSIRFVFVRKEGNYIYTMAFNEQGCPDYEKNTVDNGRMLYKNSKWEVSAPLPDTVAGNFIDARGRKQGRWVTMDTLNGKIFKTVGYYKDDLRDNVWNYYYSDGSLMQHSYYKRGIIDGVWHNFRGNGTISDIIVYKEGVFIWLMAFGEQGCPLSEQSVKDKERILYENGKWLVSAPRPKMKADNFTDSLGQKQGKWVELDTLSDDKSKIVCYYKDGREDSVYNIYYSKGNLKCRTYYKRGIKDGISHIFWDDGVIHFIFVYKNDSLVWSMEFNRQGCPYYEENAGIKEANYYKNGKWDFTYFRPK